MTYRSGNHKTELDLLVVRRQQLCTIKDCKVITGEYVTTQHKPVVFIVRMQNDQVVEMYRGNDRRVQGESEDKVLGARHRSGSSGGGTEEVQRLFCGSS